MCTTPYFCCNSRRHYVRSCVSLQVAGRHSVKRPCIKHGGGRFSTVPYVPFYKTGRGRLSTVSLVRFYIAEGGETATYRPVRWVLYRTRKGSVLHRHLYSVLCSMKEGTALNRTLCSVLYIREGTVLYRLPCSVLCCRGGRDGYLLSRPLGFIQDEGGLCSPTSTVFGFM